MFFHRPHAINFKDSLKNMYVCVFACIVRFTAEKPFSGGKKWVGAYVALGYEENQLEYSSLRSIQPWGISFNYILPGMFIFTAISLGWYPACGIVAVTV